MQSIRLSRAPLWTGQLPLVSIHAVAAQAPPLPMAQLHGLHASALGPPQSCGGYILSLQLFERVWIFNVVLGIKLI